MPQNSYKLPYFSKSLIKFQQWNIYAEASPSAGASTRHIKRNNTAEQSPFAVPITLRRSWSYVVLSRDRFYTPVVPTESVFLIVHRQIYQVKCLEFSLKLCIINFTQTEFIRCLTHLRCWSEHGARGCTTDSLASVVLENSVVSCTDSNGCTDDISAVGCQIIRKKMTVNIRLVSSQFM